MDVIVSLAVESAVRTSAALEHHLPTRSWSLEGPSHATSTRRGRFVGLLLVIISVSLFLVGCSDERLTRHRPLQRRFLMR